MPITRRTALAAAAASPSILLNAAERNPLKYLQIGTGHPHANKIGVYRDSPDWQIVGVVEEDPKRLADAKKSKTYRDLPFLSLEEGLNLNIDAVGIETEVQDLLKYCGLAIEAGFHCHLDKPAGESLETYERIMKKADARNLVVQMGYMYRFNPAVQMLHRCLDAGWLGEIFETHAVMSKVLPASSRRVLDDFEGGIMFELGCHIIDLTVGVLGKPDTVTAFPRRTLETNEDTLIDNMLAVLEYPKATATVRSTGLEVDGFARRHFTVCGTGGTFHIQPLDRPSVTLSLSEERKFEGEERVFKRGKNEIQFDPPYSRYVGDAADLAKIIRGEKKNSYPSEHDLAVQETVLRASAVIR
ncbi:MAG: Gfo/Idh/MocA family oxidoreductase [Verrucomicrobiales bacterium]|nr:Gfo/Idh/MocA family oxidoreductase [Verrucomicrobiales bacterium]